MEKTIQECLRYFASIGDIETMKIIIQIKKEEQKNEN